MPFDSRFIGFWIGINGLSQVAQDPQSGDGFWYLGGPNPTDYVLPDPDTLAYPIGRRLWKRVESTSSGTIVGHWRHDADPQDPTDQGEEMIFRADNTYIDFWDGENIFYNGTYSLTQDAAGLHIVISEYRARMQTYRSTYTTTSVDGTVQNGSFQFDVSPAGKDTVTLTSSDPQIPPETLTRQ